MAGGIERVITQNSTVQLVNSSDWGFGTSDKTEVNTSTVWGQIEAYEKCNVLQDAIDIKARYHSSLKLSAQKDTGDWIGGNYGTPSEKAVVKQDLSKLRMFNEQENFMRFNYRLKSNLHIFGECHVWKQPIVGFKGKYNFYIIPYNLVTPIYDTFPKYDIYFKPIPSKYQVEVPSGIIELSTDEVFTFRDGVEGFKPNRSTQSRLVALQEPISAILSANQMFTQLIADGGARGIIGQGAKDAEAFGAPYLDEEKMLIQRDLKQYGKLRSQLKYIVTRGQASYIPLTASITDMQLPENLLGRKIDIYRAFGIPTAFAINESRFKVLPEARKELFTSAVIPEGEDLFGDILRMVEMPDREWNYLPDYSHMDFFQEPLLQAGTALQQAANAVVPLVANGIWTTQEANSELTPYKR
jgi:hypothetical protein